MLSQLSETGKKFAVNKRTTNVNLRNSNNGAAVSMRQGEAQISATYFNDTLIGGIHEHTTNNMFGMTNQPVSELQHMHPNDQFGVSMQGQNQFANTQNIGGIH